MWVVRVWMGVGGKGVFGWLVGAVLLGWVGLGGVGVMGCKEVGG